jgi:hypothetical protein
MTPAENLATISAGVVDTGGKFATGVNDTGGKFATLYAAQARHVAKLELAPALLLF